MPVSTLGGAGSSQKSQVHVFPPTPSIDTHQTRPVRDRCPCGRLRMTGRKSACRGQMTRSRHIRSNVPEAFSRAFSELATMRPEQAALFKTAYLRGSRNGMRAHLQGTAFTRTDPVVGRKGCYCQLLLVIRICREGRAISDEPSNGIGRAFLGTEETILSVSP